MFLASPAQAGFFSFLDEKAYAETDKPTPTPPVDNSQNIALLQANVSSASILQDKKDKKDNKDSPIDEKTTVNIVSDSALLSAVGPTGVYDGDDSLDAASFGTSVYVVRKGDSLSVIADMFGVSVNTILWANDMKKGEKLVPGDVLFILPVSGLEHKVTKGQTLKGIAQLYKADVLEISQYNNIAEGSALTEGDTLIIPNAQKSEEGDRPVKNLEASNAKDRKYYERNPTRNLSGYFINPVPGYRKSQGLHDKNGVDLAISTGTPIRASASGRVTLARNGYNGGFGNLVIISHPNGTETLYAHQSKLSTTTGAQVSQGEIIGYVGSTGRSTGPHLHFEVHGARNPGADGSWVK